MFRDILQGLKDSYNLKGEIGKLIDRLGSKV